MKKGFSFVGPKSIAGYVGSKVQGYLYASFVIVLAAFGAMVVSGDIIVRAIGAVVAVLGITGFMLALNYIQACITRAELSGEHADSNEEE